MTFLKPALLSFALITALQASATYAFEPLSAPVKPYNLLSQATPSEHSNGERGHSRRAGGPGKMWQELNLSEQQKQQMKTLMESQREAFKANREQWQSILTSEQKAKLQTLKEQRKANKGEGSRGQFLGELNLSDEQKAQMKAMREAGKQKREAFHQQMMSILTPEQREKMKAIKEQHKGQGWGKRHHKENREPQGQNS